ncbi:MAG TPA: transcriptional repressor, partial [Hydrogenobaculum sp.]|nr:transcriptional repressor [Hydrogenobaculum sp.]
MNTKKLKEEFRAFLKKHNYKITKNRLDLIDIIANYKKHFEIEELVNYIQNTQKLASRATIYRTVKLLMDFGIIKEIIKQNNKTIYEFCNQEGHHDHLVCVSCGRIIEFFNEDI